MFWNSLQREEGSIGSSMLLSSNCRGQKPGQKRDAISKQIVVKSLRTQVFSKRNSEARVRNVYTDSFTERL